MDALGAWWGGLTSVNQWFYSAAFFFGAIFLWQMIAAFFGLGHGADSDLDTHVESDWSHDTPADAHETLVAFKLVSIRSILAFFTLFTWAAALYMNVHIPVFRSLLYALAWGVAAMIIVAVLFHFLRRLTETGTLRIASCVGAAGTVYLDIPAGGDGEIRIACNGVMTHVKARMADGSALKSGVAVRVRRVLGPNAVEVELDGGAKERTE